MKSPVKDECLVIDMSPGAIDRRLRDLSQIQKLGMSLRSASRIGKLKNVEAEKGGLATESTEDTEGSKKV